MTRISIVSIDFKLKHHLIHNFQISLIHFSSFRVLSTTHFDSAKRLERLIFITNYNDNHLNFIINTFKLNKIKTYFTIATTTIVTTHNIDYHDNTYNQHMNVEVVGGCSFSETIKTQNTKLQNDYNLIY